MFNKVDFMTTKHHFKDEVTKSFLNLTMETLQKCFDPATEIEGRKKAIRCGFMVTPLSSCFPGYFTVLIPGDFFILTFQA